jgi:hypothetical protein
MKAMRDLEKTLSRVKGDSGDLDVVDVDVY